MVNLEMPTLDGIAPSWADIKVTAMGGGLPLIQIADIKSINTGTTLEIGVVRGASGGRKRKRTTGQGDSQASIELYREGYQTLLRNLKTAAQSKGYMRAGGQVIVGLVAWEIGVQHTPPGSFEVFHYKIKGCRIGGRDMNGAEGPDPDVVTVNLNTMDIVDIIDGQEVVLL